MMHPNPSGKGEGDAYFIIFGNLLGHYMLSRIYLIIEKLRNKITRDKVVIQADHLNE